MTIDRDRERATRSKYRGLYTHLYALAAHEWRPSFGEIESIIGFKLPPSARRHRPWWANQSNRRSQSLAWSVAGWETAEVDMDSEKLLLRRRRPEAARKPSHHRLPPVR